MDSITVGCILRRVDMTYDQLVAFLAVADEGGFVAASATLHKSQPAVSKLVRNLEDELGVALFDRSQYRATLSDAGRLLRERAAAVVEHTEALRTFGRQLGGRIEPVVRLAIEAVTPVDPILVILRGVQERFRRSASSCRRSAWPALRTRCARTGRRLPSRPPSGSDSRS